MADISALPFVNFGASQATQGQAASASNLENQQAQAAAMQNQLMAAKLPMMLAAYKGAQDHITDFSHPNHDTVPTASFNPDEDQSGVGSGPPAGQNRVRPYDMIGRDSKTTNAAQNAIQNKYYVDPRGTDQEQAAIEQAYDWSQRAHLVSPELGASADKQLEQAKYNKEQGVAERTKQANLDASKHYEALSNVSTADHPWQQLAAVDKESAARIKAQNPNASEDDLDQIAKTQAESTGAFLHRFTGRKSVKGEDGIYRDEDTNEPTLGITPAGFKPEEIQKIRETGLQAETRTVDGRDVTKQKLEWAGFAHDDIDGYVNRSIAQGRAVQASQLKVADKRQQAQLIQAHAGVPAAQRITSPGTTPTSTVQSIDAANTPQAQGAAANHQLQKPPGSIPTPPTVVPPPKSPTATKADLMPPSTNSPNGKLDLSDAKKSVTPNTPGQLPDRAKASDQDNKYWDKLQAKDSEMGSTATAANTAVQIATNAQNALKNDAAHGNTAASRQWMQTALGNPESLRYLLGDATSSAILRKMLGNQAFTNLETDANGNQMRLGSQTIRVAMDKLSASPEMTAEAITALSGQVIKNAQYELQKAKDYGAYRNAGNNINDFDRWYGTKYGNKSTIDTGPQMIKVTHPTKGNGSIPESQWEKAQKLGYKKVTE